MVYRYTIDNILSLMQNVGRLERLQLKTFFSAELAPNKVEYLLNQLAVKHILIYNQEKDDYTFIGTPQMSADVSRRLVLRVLGCGSAGKHKRPGSVHYQVSDAVPGDNDRERGL